MTPTTETIIIEGNKLIELFVHPERTFKGDWIYWNDIAGTHVHVSVLNYHTSWDWLMPVVIKIENIDEFPFEYLSTDINNVWQEVIKFIQWYNSQNKKP